MSDNRKLRSILAELDQIIPEKGKYAIVEARAQHVIHSAINLLKLIDESFTEEESEKLTKRFLLSIKNHNPQKFENTIRGLRESQE